MYINVIFTLFLIHKDPQQSVNMRRKNPLARNSQMHVLPINLIPDLTFLTLDVCYVL